MDKKEVVKWSQICCNVKKDWDFLALSPIASAVFSVFPLPSQALFFMPCFAWKSRIVRVSEVSQHTADYTSMLQARILEGVAFSIFPQPKGDNVRRKFFYSAEMWEAPGNSKSILAQLCLCCGCLFICVMSNFCDFMDFTFVHGILCANTEWGAILQGILLTCGPLESSAFSYFFTVDILKLTSFGSYLGFHPL